MVLTEEERLARWRLLLGKDAEEETISLTNTVLTEMDATLQALYNTDHTKSKRGSLAGSAPMVHRWLGDIRKYFPVSVVQVMQRDAMEYLGVERLLSEPSVLEMLQPDIHLVATLISLGNVIPDSTKETARQLVRKLVDELMRKLSVKTIQAIRGSLDRASRNNRPRANEINFDRTIKVNLKNWQPEEKFMVVDRLVGHGRRRRSLRDIVLCVDESGSMATSVIYSSIFAAVLASLHSVTTKMILFDTEIADMTAVLSDPVDLLFGAQLGGGTDINRALTYCETQIERPNDTIFVLISDLCEGGDNKKMLARAKAIAESGVTFITLVALSDTGTPDYDSTNAAAFASLGIPVFACTPDLFPDLMAAAINHQNVTLWAGENKLPCVIGAANKQGM